MKYWQDGFLSLNHISGTPGEVGAVSHIAYQIGNRQIVLKETVLTNNLPEAFHGRYEGDFGMNTMYNYFDELDSRKTRWRSEIEYTEMKGLVMKLMSFFMPSMFQKQTQKWMDQFKELAEQGL